MEPARGGQSWRISDELHSHHYCDRREVQADPQKERPPASRLTQTVGLALVQLATKGK